VPSFIKEQQSANLSLKTCFFVWKIVRTPLPVIDKDNHLSKLIFYLSVLQMKSSSTCLFPASLCEGPFFYYYVESPPSTFMHRLREHSCHSEFNVHSPKVYHWLIHDYGFACINYLYLVSLLNLKVSYAFMFCYSMKEKLKTTFICFSIWFEHTLDFQCFIVHDLSFVFFFSCYNMVAKLLLSRLCLLCPCFKFFDPSTQCFTSLIKIVMVHVTSKIILLLSLTYLRTSRS
jgi:hypothetical protein